MTQRKSKVEIDNYIDAQYSSGDSNKMTMKQHYQEENNNEINELSKELSVMGCIVDAVKKPPNICVETCVHEDVIDSGDDETSKTVYENGDDAYSDAFEEDDSDNEDQSIRTKVKSVKSESARDRGKHKAEKLTKSHSSMSTHRPSGSVSGRSTDYGSISVPPTRRINMSFTNDRLRDIERHNHILLNKILSVRDSKKSSIPPRNQPIRKPMPPAAVQRKQQQRRIDHDNMILLKKIQRVKSSSYSIRR